MPPAATSSRSAWSAAAAAARGRPRRPSRPTRTSSCGPWATPSRTGWRSASKACKEGRHRGQDRRAPRAAVRRLRRLQAGDRLLRRGAALHAAAVPAAAPEGRRRGRQARLRREAGGRRCPGRPPRPGDLRRSGQEKPLGRLGPLPALRLAVPGNGQAHSRRRSRQGDGPAGQRLPRPDLGQAAAAGLDRHDLADAELVLLHLAVGRLQRRAARPLPRRLRLDHEGRISRRGPSAWAAGRSAPARNSATSTTTSRSSTNTTTGRSCSATAASRPAARTT